MKVADLVPRVYRLLGPERFTAATVSDQITDTWARVFSNSRLSPDQQEAIVVLAAYRLLTEDTASDRLKSMKP